MEDDIELLPSNHSMKYGQECWFTKLPPVLNFELSKSENNQPLISRKEFLISWNFLRSFIRTCTETKNLLKVRECIWKLKEEVKVLQQNLERYVIEFTRTKPAPESSMSQSGTRMTLPLSSVC